MNTLNEFANNYTFELNQTLISLDRTALEQLTSLLQEAYQNEKNIFVLGNGGSAACATHWVCDFNKGVNVPGSKRAKLYSLSDNTGIITALGNDISYDDIFAYQLQNFAQSGDLVLALSVSGSSPNLVKAMEYARSIGCKTAAALGDYNGKVSTMVDTLLCIGSKNYGVVEDVHLVLNHIISQYIKDCNMEEGCQS